MKNTKNKSNKLISEKSPYLLQHAYNPVNWYPWGEEAFEKAEKEDKPIFLSIGYSTCHWCHVMEHESFEDEEVAKLLNDAFICIKVDREERPDIDSIYMLVCQMMTGSGGWPLNVLLDSQRRPFFAGTYFPKESNFGRLGMVELIPKLNNVWKNKRTDIEESSSQILEILTKSTHNDSNVEFTTKLLDDACTNLLRNYDSVYGGFGSAPKFPSPQNFLFLLRQYSNSKNNDVLEVIENTLQHMAQGGMHDQIGYGFHRYSTDQRWLVPHFEKMLYDQAMLCLAFTETYQLTKKEIYKEVAEKIIAYVLRDMTSLEGGFYSAEDADSEGVEGKFYVWTEDELKNILKDDFEFAKGVFNVNKDGNFLEESTREKTGENILHMIQSKSQEAQKLNMAVEDFEKRLERIREILFEVRKQRIHPYKDDKILTDWNGLMIMALARASYVFNSEKYLKAAEESVNFILSKLLDANGRLIHRYRDRDSALQANLDDYSFLIAGLLEIYQANFNPKYLKLAMDFSKHLIHHFWDEKMGGFYFIPDYGEKLIVRKKEIYDGAIPSGNSIMLGNLISLYKITGDEKYKTYTSKLMNAFSGDISVAPHGFTQFLCAADSIFNQSQEIILVGKKESKELILMIEVLRNAYMPRATVLVLEPDDNELSKFIPHLSAYKQKDNLPTAYICSNNTCSKPVTNLEEFQAMLVANGLLL